MTRRDPLILLLCSFFLISEPPRSLGAGSLDQLHAPEGFVIEQAAGPSEVTFPMFAAFDDRGRLFVAESSGLDLYAELSAQTRKCRIRLLEDSDGDGRFEKAKVFADNLVFPMGLVWRDGKLYVADPPDLITLEDVDGDGRADQRSAILGEFGHRDNGSLHGLTFGPDGLLYMTMGEPDGYNFKRSDGAIIQGQSGALIRCKPDGSGVEVLCRGFVNLVEVVFTESNEIIGTDNWFQMPSAGMRDALVHLVEGGLYPLGLKDVGTAQPVTGVSLRPASLFPAVALSGLMRYRGQAFPEEMRGNLFSAQHNSRKVGRHILVREGSSFRIEDFDFVTGDDPDFHPSDVLEAADGSLLIIDTGGWYVQHCPTGKIRNSRATGGIYRVSYKNAKRLEDPWGAQVDWFNASIEQLANLLSDARPEVGDRAQRILSARGEPSIPKLTDVLASEATVSGKLKALWALSAIPGEMSLAELRKALRAPLPELSAAAGHALALRGARQVGPDLCSLLASGPAFVRLAAAQALARCGEANSLRALWTALEGEIDPFLEHAVVHALHRVASTPDLELALQNAHPRVQRAALQLLDQPPRPSTALAYEEVMKRVGASDPDLRKTALRILQGHPEWAKHTLHFIADWLARPALTTDEQLGLRSLILAFQAESAVQELLGMTLSNPKIPAERLLFLLEVLSLTSLPSLPQSWIGVFSSVLRSSDSSIRLQAIRTVALLQVSSLDEALARVAESPDEPVDLRMEALRGLAPRHAQLSTSAVEFLLGQLKSGSDPVTKFAATEVLHRSRLTGSQVLRAWQAMRGDALISPSALLPALPRSIDLETAKALLDFLEENAKGGWRPSEEELVKFAQQVPSELRAKAESLRESLPKDAEFQKSKLAEFERLLARGDAELGRALFFSSKVACGTCHSIGSAGGKVGPDLTKIGAVRSGRDILESILFPSSTFAQGYDNYLVTSADGRDFNGVIVRQSSEALVLRDASGGEVQLRKNQIHEMRRSTVSLMPEGLERGLTPEEFRDLLAFLQSLK